MIQLTKLNKEEFYLNPWQIQMIEIIPEAKIVMMNHEFFIVRESVDEVINKIVQFNRESFSGRNTMVVDRTEA